MVASSPQHFNFIRRETVTILMKTGLTTFGVLLFAIMSWPVFSQKLSKDEILNEYRSNQTTPSIDSIFRWDIHARTRALLDKLLKDGVDTLVVYSIGLPGYYAKNDSCSTIYPTNSYFFWKRNGKYLFSEIDGRCVSRVINGNSKVINFAIDNYVKIADEFFMEPVSSVERNGDYLRVAGSSMDHEPKYSILVMIHDQHNYLTFTENGLTNKSSLFLDYNKGLNSYKLFELIKTQIKND